MNRKPSVGIIFLTVFIDLVGFGIVVPLIQLYSHDYGAHGFIIGLIIASYSAMQFIFSPIWGRLSDRIGRRPVLLFSTFGAALSYVLFAISAWFTNPTVSLWVLIGSRMLAGICGGNIAVAQAYIADITPPENRSKRMGLIGAAFGLGFIFGPVIGGLSLKYFGASGPGWAASALCAVNFLLAFFILSESRKPTSEPIAQRPQLAQWKHTLSHPKLGLLVIVFFIATFCFSCFESTLLLLLKDNFHLDTRNNEAAAATGVYLFAYCAVISAYVQGGMIGRLVKKSGEVKLISISLVMTAISMGLLPFIHGNTPLTWNILSRPEGVPWIFMLFTLALLAVGSSLTRPPLFGMLSNLTPTHEQGATIGVAQGASSLARIFGSIFAPTALHYFPPVPYVTCAILLIFTAIYFSRKVRINSA